MAFNDQRFQVGAGCIESSGVSGAPGPDDDYVANFANGMISIAEN